MIPDCLFKEFPGRGLCNLGKPFLHKAAADGWLGKLGRADNPGQELPLGLSRALATLDSHRATVTALLSDTGESNHGPQTGMIVFKL